MTTTKSTPRDVFLYLLMTAALYAIAVSAISLLFQYVHALFPDPLDWRGLMTETLRRALSVLIIVTPVYVWVMRFLNRDLVAQPEKQRMSIRRWLVHLTLFLSGVTIIVDLVTLVYNFLGGDLSSRFALKTVAVLMVAAVVFAYYIWDIRRDVGVLSQKMVWLVRISLTLLTVAVVGGFFLMESPAQQRARKLDDQRVSDLWSVQAAVENYWWARNVLPESLDDVSDATVLKDPETGESYEYRKTAEDAYELCATFSLSSQESVEYLRPAPFSSAKPQKMFNTHEAGFVCYERSTIGLREEVK